MKISIKGPFTGTIDVPDDSNLLQLRQAIAHAANVDLSRIKLLSMGKVSSINETKIPGKGMYRCPRGS